MSVEWWGSWIVWVVAMEAALLGSCIFAFVVSQYPSKSSIKLSIVLQNYFKCYASRKNYYVHINISLNKVLNCN